MNKKSYTVSSNWWLISSTTEKITVIGIVSLVIIAGFWLSVHPSDDCLRGQVALEQATARVETAPRYDQAALCDAYKHYLSVLNQFPSDWPRCMHDRGDQRGAWLAAQISFYSELTRTKCA